MVILGFVSDMDGVVADTEDVWYRGTRKFLESTGVKFSREEHKKFIGKTERDDARTFKKDFGMQMSEDEMVKKRREYIVDEMEGRVKINDGYAELLDMLERGGVKISLVSSSPMRIIDIVLEEIGTRGRFSHIVSAENDIDKTPAYSRAAGMMGLDPSECFALEDSPSGARAAKAAGIYCVVVPNPALEGVDFSFADETHKDIRGFLKNGKILKHIGK